MLHSQNHYHIAQLRKYRYIHHLKLILHRHIPLFNLLSRLHMPVQLLFQVHKP